MLASTAIDLKAESARLNKAEGLSNSINFPWLSTAITSESIMVFKRCAIVSTVQSANSRLMVKKFVMEEWLAVSSS